MSAPTNSILIVDDTAIFRAVLTGYFQMAGWHVFQAADGAGGIQSALANHPSFIICDMVMPNGDGSDVCRRVRAEPALQGTKFVMYSGNEDEATRRAAFAAGADVYVVKPVRMADVLDLVHVLGSPDYARNQGNSSSPRIFFTDQSASPDAGSTQK